MKNMFSQGLRLSILGLALVAGAALAQQASTPQADGNGSPSRLPGAEAPPAIPGYDPTTEPRDFSGVWRSLPQAGVNPFELASDLELNARGAAAARQRVDRLLASKSTSIAVPHVMCRPAGIVDVLTPIAPIYILQNPREMVFIVADEMRSVIHVYLEKEHPKDLTASYEGDSIAHWEGNTLVVDTVGYNGHGELGIMGPGRHPMEGAVYSKRMHLVRRITKSPDGRTLVIQATFYDPDTMAHPASVTKRWAWVNGQQPLEYDCEENPREDNFAGILFEDDYLVPVCIQYEGKGSEPSEVICDAKRKQRN